ncbi:hypothetical protein V6N13_067416 [Hibiscus sabdariffa]
MSVFSRETIHCIKKVDTRRGGDALVVVIQELVRKEWKVKLSYMLREFNTVVDKLVSIMCGHPIGEVAFEVMPDLVRDIVITEASLRRNLHEDPSG